MRVCLSSMFANSTRYLVRYTEQCRALRDALSPDELVFVWLEGNSRDGTYEVLSRLAGERAFAFRILKHDCPTIYGSTEQPERMAQLGMLGNEILEGVVQTGADVFLYVESDLIWSPEVMTRLVHHALTGPDAVSPLVMIEGTDVHYDIWAVRAISSDEMDGGIRFGPFAPYSHALEGKTGPVEVYSAGSAMAIRTEVLKAGARYRSDLAFVGLSEEMRRLGFHIYVDPALVIHHPR